MEVVATLISFSFSPSLMCLVVRLSVGRWKWHTNSCNDIFLKHSLDDFFSVTYMVYTKDKTVQHDTEVWLNRVMLQIAPNPCRSDLHSHHQVFPTESSNVRSWCTDNMQSVFEIAQSSTYKMNKKWGISAVPFIVIGKKNSSAGIFWKIFHLSPSLCGNFLIRITVTKSKPHNFVLKSHVFFKLWNVACYLHPDWRKFLHGALDLCEGLVRCWCWDWTNPVTKSSSLFACKGPSLQVFCLHLPVEAVEMVYLRGFYGQGCVCTDVGSALQR